jgi:excinuclease UvrABC ATPase subunit
MTIAPIAPSGRASSADSPFGNIEVRGARENNLKNISLDIPRRQITVFTGVSGSGKSSLVFDTVAAESQRLINETFSTFVKLFLPRNGQPDADALHKLSTAIIVDQQRLGGNPRSTLGTATDVFTMFRVLFARIGSPKVPHALALSFNDPRGMCPECEGLARASKIDIDALVDKSKSLAEGAILFPTFNVDGYHWSIFANSGLFDVKKKSEVDRQHEKHVRRSRRQIQTHLPRQRCGEDEREPAPAF